MTYQVHQPWDPLNACIVGRSYPAEFYSQISDDRVKTAMQRIAVDTEEDLQYLVNLLEKFGVTVIRPELVENLQDCQIDGQFLPPPLTPRDDTAMIGTTFYMPTPVLENKWNTIKGSDWPNKPPHNIHELPTWLQKELRELFGIDKTIQLYDRDFSTLSGIEHHIQQQGNKIVYDQKIDSAMISRVGKDLYFGTWQDVQDTSQLQKAASEKFPDYRCHVINTNGHLDGTFCVVVPGLIVSTHYIPQSTFEEFFPGWKVYYLDPIKDHPKDINQGKWWVPGEEDNINFTQFVNSKISNWTGYMQETVIDVNMLIIDTKNVVCIRENQGLFEILNKYGITPHLAPLRHYHFWDSGIHCMTSDLDRKGTQQDFFPERN